MAAEPDFQKFTFCLFFCKTRPGLLLYNFWNVKCNLIRMPNLCGLWFQDPFRCRLCVAIFNIDEMPAELLLRLRTECWWTSWCATSWCASGYSVKKTVNAKWPSAILIWRNLIILYFSIPIDYNLQFLAPVDTFKSIKIHHYETYSRYAWQ